MKRFLERKWHGIPLVIMTAVMLVCLVAGSAFAAFNFLSLTTEIFVDEPLSIEYNLQSNYGGDSDWHPLGDEDSMTLDRSAGDSFVMDLRITNDADNALTVNTVFSSDTPGTLQWFTFTGFPDGTAGNCPNGSTTFNDVTIDVSGAAPAPVTYTVTFSFERS